MTSAMPHVTDDLAQCEMCERFIGPREEYYLSQDGDLCEQCAPTWAEEVGHCREAAAEAERQNDPEMAAHWAERADDIEREIASGLKRGEAKAVFAGGDPDVVLQ